MYTRQQAVAMLNSITGEAVNRTLAHEGNEVWEFYSQDGKLGTKCQVGDAAKIRALELRKQKHDRWDADLTLSLLAENRFFSDLDVPAGTARSAGLVAAPASSHRSVFMLEDSSKPVDVRMQLGLRLRRQLPLHKGIVGEFACPEPPKFHAPCFKSDSLIGLAHASKQRCQRSV